MLTEYVKNVKDSMSLPGQENMIILLQFYSLCTGYLLSSVISYKILLLAYKALNDLTPVYLTYLLSLQSNPLPKVAKLWTLGST